MKEELINEFDIPISNNVCYSQSYVENLQSQLKAKEEMVEIMERYFEDNDIQEIYEILGGKE